MAEWLYEEGIGEHRAILVEDGEIVEAAVEWPGELRAGAVLAGRLVEVSGRKGIVATCRGEVLAEPLPAGLSQGQSVRVEIVREPIAEPGRPKRALGRITDEAEQEGPALAERLPGSTARLPTSSDLFEAAGWSELLEEAATGEIAFPGGGLRLSLTPAMTLFDVDGYLPAAELAVAGAAAAARAIRRLGIGGSIGIDLPTLGSRDERQRAAAAVDAILPQPFERTAVNGFGFLQIVRRRTRASLPERIQSDPAGAAARALLRRAERSGGAGPRTLAAAPAVVATIEAHPEWLDALARRLGAPVALRADPALAISAGHVHAAFAS
ncbi:MAG: ribonuclease [Allosphingosinicella sp.]